MKVQVHLTFNGQCEEAFRFYAECLQQVKLSFLMRYGDSPLAADVPATFHHKILHASLTAQGNSFAGSDSLENDYRVPAGFCVLLDVEDACEAERIFAALAEGGSVKMPLQQTFWATRFSVLTDRFGTPWEINCSGG